MKRTKEEMVQHLRFIRDCSFDDCKRLAATLILNKVKRGISSEDDHSEVMFIYQFIKDYINLDIDTLFTPELILE